MKKVVIEKKGSKKPAALVAKKSSSKASVKKAPAKKRVREPLEVTPIKDKMTKSELSNYISEETEFDLKTVKSIMAALEGAILGSLAPRGIGEFTLPGVCKFVTKKIPAKKVPARKAGTMVRNPRTGEETPAEARAAYVKPATVKVKIKPLNNSRRAATGT